MTNSLLTLLVGPAVLASVAAAIYAISILSGVTVGPHSGVTLMIVLCALVATFAALVVEPIALVLAFTRARAGRLKFTPANTTFVSVGVASLLSAIWLVFSRVFGGVSP